MKTFSVLMTAFAVGLLGAASAPPTIKKAMAELHKGKTAALPTISSAIKAEPPDWKEIQKLSKVIAELGESLTKNDPPKGDKDDYLKVAKAYAASTKSLDEAALTENLTDVKASITKLQSTCKACHTAHKPN